VNTVFFRQKVVQVLSLASLAVISNSLSTAAQTVDTTRTEHLTQSIETEVLANETSAEVETFTSVVSAQTPVESTFTKVDSTPVIESEKDLVQRLRISKQETANLTVTPVPGTTATISKSLTSQDTEAQSQSSASEVAQADISIARPTRGGSSYLGIGGNIGLGGESALGDGNFTVISKVGLTNAISVRPSVVIGDNTVVLLPVSYDFSFQQLADPFSEPLPIAPYVGAGAAIQTGDDSEVSFLLSGGIDVPITRQFTATAAVNAAFFDETDIGLMIGVGYNFRGLGF
jgi:hypothetical protein